VSEAGIPRRCLSAMVESGTIYRVDHDIVKVRHRGDIQVINQAMKAYASYKD